MQFPHVYPVVPIESVIPFDPGLVIGAYAIAIAYKLVLLGIVRHANRRDDTSIERQTPTLLANNTPFELYLSVGLVGPVIEEFLFRIVPFVAGMAAFGPPGAVYGVVVGSVVWADKHNEFGLLTHGVAAIPESLAVLMGAPVVAIALHVFHNTSVLTLSYLSNTG